MIIKIDNAQFYYDLFYQLSFLIVLLIYLIEGFYRKFPWTTWLLVLVTVRLFFIAGTKFGAISIEDFNYLMHNFQLPEMHSKNMLGGLIFGLGAIGLSKIVLRIKYPIFNAFAVGVPFAMAIQRVGCLLAGCCFGNETSHFLGIKYGVNSSAFYQQLLSHDINTVDTLSLPVHPVPLYIIIYCSIIVMVMLKFRHYWKRPGNLALSSLLLLMVGRFIVEFFRAPQSNGDFLGIDIMGLKVVQIICLAIILILAIIIFYREKNIVANKFEKHENHPLYNSFYLLFLTSVLVITKNWFTYVEFIVLLLILIPASIGVLWQLIKFYPSLKVRVSTISVLLLSFFLMGQTSVDQGKTKSFKSIKLGYSQGEYESYHSSGRGEGCDRQSLGQDFQQQYKLIGGGYSITKEEAKNVFEYGLNGYFGQQKEYGVETGVNNEILIAGINPFVNYEMNWLGVGGGLHLGNLSNAPEHWSEQGEIKMPETGSKRSPVYPQFSVRLGHQRFLFLKYNFANQFPSPFPGQMHQIELGTGLGLKNGTRISFGATYESENPHLSAYIPIKNKYVLEPFYSWRNKSASNYPYYFSIGLHYRFGHEIK